MNEALEGGLGYVCLQMLGQIPRLSETSWIPPFSITTSFKRAYYWARMLLFVLSGTNHSGQSLYYETGGEEKGDR
jgi:hypothetical protein